MIRSYSDDELIKIMDTAPLPVQQAVESKATAAIVSGLGIRLGLHIDMIGKIAVLNVQMLLGLVNPQEFLNELIAAKVSDKDAQAIMSEINQKIFIPLRQEMMRGAGNGQPPKPSIPAVAPAAPAAGAGQSTSHFHLQNKLPAPPRPTLPPAPQTVRPPIPRPAPFPQPLRPVSAQQPMSPRPAVSNSNIAPLPPKIILPGSFGNMKAMSPRPIPTPMPASAQKPLESSKLLEDHEEPHIDISAETPLQQALRTVLPPPPNLPGAMPPRVVPEVRPIPPAPKVETPAPTIPTPPVSPKPYSADPYREPIE